MSTSRSRFPKRMSELSAPLEREASVIRILGCEQVIEAARDDNGHGQRQHPGQHDARQDGVLGDPPPWATMVPAMPEVTMCGVLTGRHRETGETDQR